MRCAVRAHYGRRSGPSGFLTTRRARRSKGKGGTPHGVPPCFMIENSPLSGEFQKGEAYSCQKRSSPLLQKSCPDFRSSKGERQWMIKV